MGATAIRHMADEIDIALVAANWLRAGAQGRWTLAGKSRKSAAIDRATPPAMCQRLRIAVWRVQIALVSARDLAQPLKNADELGLPRDQAQLVKRWIEARLQIRLSVARLQSPYLKADTRLQMSN